jgi:hypothetical protein
VPHHVGDLDFLGRAAAGDGQLDLAGRVLVHGHLLHERSAQRRRPRLAELQRAVGIAMHEHALDADLVRPVFLDQPRAPSKMMRKRSAISPPRVRMQPLAR